MQLVPEAIVHHELPPFLPERFRRGYEVVAACWTDPDLGDNRVLKLGPFAIPIFYGRDVALDVLRVVRGRREMSMTWWQVAAAVPLFPLFRLVDVAGMLKAVFGGRPKRMAESGVL